MKMSKRILSSILAILMVVSVCSVGFTANAADVSSGAKLEEIVLEPIARPVVEFTCTEVTRVAAAVNSVEPGETIVKATPSGVPELSGAYAAQAYAGETPVKTTITFTSPTVGVQVNGISCNNENVVLSDVNYVNGKYTVTVESGTVAKNTDGTYNPLVFTVDYTWTDGNQYQEKCVSYVEPIVTGGSYVEAQSEIQALSGTGSYYRVWASASTRLLGKGVYYEQPASIETSTTDPYRQYGVYNVATGTKIENVAAGYNTLLYADDKTDKPAGKMNQANELSVPGATLAHVYVDSSVASTLADQNIRLDANVGMLSDRNNDNPYTALADVWVSTGSNTDSLVTTNNATAQAAIGLGIPAKADYGVKQFEQNASMTTLTGGVGQYGNIFTQTLTGNVANLVDGASYTVTLKYHAYMWVKKGLLQHYNMTSSATVPVSMTFHIVDKGALREMIDYVMNTEPNVPTTRAQTKGVNPQSWYYSSGFSNFQTNYVNALNTLNNPKANQGDIDAKVDALNQAYKGLTLKGADYSKVTPLNTQAKNLLKNSKAYTPESVALLQKAVDEYTTGYNILYQNVVDTMGRNLQTAIDNLEFKAADYSVINNKKVEFNALTKADYVPETWTAVENAFAKVDYTLTGEDQDQIDAWATEILAAMNNLVKIVDLARWAGLDDALAEAKAYTDLDDYVDGAAVTKAIAAAEAAKAQNEEKLWTKDRQDEIDDLEGDLRTAIDNLKLKDADKSALEAALKAKLPEKTGCYDQTILADYQELVVQGTEMLNDANLTIKDQADIDEMAENLEAKYAELMDSLAHNPSAPTYANIVSATCTTDGGYDVIVKCTKCGEIITSEKVVNPATGHTEGRVEISNKVEATCTRAGGYDTITYCDVCGEIMAFGHETIPALGHTNGAEVVENNVPATCTTDGGYDTVIYCTVCGVEVSRVNTVLPAFGHTPAEAVVENEVPATRDENGSYDSVVYCSVCNEQLSRETITIPALGHEAAEAVEENRKEPTCTDKGSYDMVVYCSCCEEKTELSRESFEIPALGHTPGEAYTANEVEKTCTTPGSYDTVVDCTVCGAEISRETVTVPAIGHRNDTAKEENRVEATCTTPGSYDMVVRCRVCGEIMSTETFEIPVIPHSYDAVVTAPTCTDEGYTTYTCSVCGDSYVDDYVDATGHSYGDWEVVTEATCTENGLKTKTCGCGDVVSEEIPATGHTDGEWVVTKEAGVGVAGEETLYCAVCGVAIDTKEIPAISAYFIEAEGSTTVIDEETGFIYGLEEGIADLEGFVEYAGGTVEYVKTAEGFGTGTVVNFVVNGEVLYTYTIVILGDVTGDGVVDTFDSTKLAEVVNGDIELEKDSAEEFAADIENNDKVADTYDLTTLYAVVNGDIELSQVK